MKLIRWFITFAYAGLIFYLSSLPSPDIPGLFPHADKVFHFFLYMGFGGFCVWAFRVTALRSRAQLPYMAALAAMLYGVTDEFHQVFVPGRTASVADFLADASGAAAGAFIAMKIAGKLRGNKNEIQDNRA